MSAWWESPPADGAWWVDPAPLPDADWYDDPWDSTQWRWWNGCDWTTDVRRPE